MDSNERNFLLSLYAFNKKLTDNQKIKKLYSMSNDIEKYYNKFNIKKRNGKERHILSPQYDLKKIQNNILNKLLYDKRVSNYAKAYVKEISLVDNVSVHKGYKYILKLDIKDFFESVSYVDIYNIFKEFGFSKRICGLLSYLTTYDDYLPQGAPTSPYLSNLVLRDFDYKIGEWCEENNINYTRYSDDMTFSMNEYNKDIIRFVRVNLYKYGLELNNDKICLIHNSKQQKITGIVVNNKIQVDSKYRKKIRQEVYYIKKYGIDEHLNKINVTDKEKYIKSLYGKILFVLSVDPKNKEFVKYKKTIGKCNGTGKNSFFDNIVNIIFSFKKKLKKESTDKTIEESKTTKIWEDCGMTEEEYFRQEQILSKARTGRLKRAEEENKNENIDATKAIKLFTREELVNKYSNYTIPEMSNLTDDEYIEYYKAHIKILEELKNDLHEIQKHATKGKFELNEKQQSCKEKCYIKENGWPEEYQQYRQSFYEMMDFIYHPGFKDSYVNKYLTEFEIVEVLELLDFLIDVANKLIIIHQSKKVETKK